jgi:hypothetical protein
VGPARPSRTKGNKIIPEYVNLLPAAEQPGSRPAARLAGRGKYPESGGKGGCPHTAGAEMQQKKLVKIPLFFAKKVSESIKIGFHHEEEFAIMTTQ